MTGQYPLVSERSIDVTAVAQAQALNDQGVVLRSQGLLGEALAEYAEAWSTLADAAVAGSQAPVFLGDLERLVLPPIRLKHVRPSLSTEPPNE